MNKNDNIVIKSNSLIQANYKLSLGEQRLIYILTSKIQKNDADFKAYKLTIKEFVDIVGVKSKNMYSEVEKYADKLRQRQLFIKTENSRLKLNWLSSAEYFDEEGIIELEFSPKLKPFLLQLKSKFTTMSLSELMNFGSIYSSRLYEILKQYQKLGSRIIEVSELKEILGIENNEYPKYANFKQKVLVIAKKELKEKSDIWFDFEEVKEKRKVVAIKFIIYSKENAVLIQKLEPTNIPKEPDADILELSESFKRSAGEEFPISELNKLIDEKGYEFVKLYFENIEKFTYNKNPVGFFIKAIREAYKIPNTRKVLNNMNNFEQRKYDEDEFKKVFSNGNIS